MTSNMPGVYCIVWVSHWLQSPFKGEETLKCFKTRYTLLNYTTFTFIINPEEIDFIFTSKLSYDIVICIAILIQRPGWI